MEERIEALREQLRLGAKNANHPMARNATAFLRDLDERLAVVKSGQPYMPRLSPKDFAVGQIGQLDDDLRLNILKVEGDVASIGVMFEKLGDEQSHPGRPVSWTYIGVPPGQFSVRAEFVADLPPPEELAGGKKFVVFHDDAWPANRLLKSHVYQVVAGEKRGLITDYVLEPFKMDDVGVWLRAEAKRPRK